MTWRERLGTVFGIDPRSMALFRVLLGGLILVDLLWRSQHLRLFYTDDGVLPRRAWGEITHRSYLSLHAASGELWWQILLFTLAAIAAFSLAIGYRTRLSNFVSLVLLASLLNRNGLLLQGGDQLLVVMCFWGLFLPLGMRFSVDAALQPHLREDPNGDRAASGYYSPYLSMATIAVTLQILYLYFFTALLKTSDVWRVSFDAAFYALSLQHFATPIGEWFLQFPLLLKLATFYVLVVEFLAPLAIIGVVLWWKQESFQQAFAVSRLAGLALLASLHVAFLLMLHIGLFPLIDFMSLSLLIPSLAWNTLSRNARADLTIYPAPGSESSLKFSLLVREFFLHGDTSIVHPDLQADNDSPPRQDTSWVVKDSLGQQHRRFDAMRVVLKQGLLTRPLYWLCSVPPLPWLANHAYRMAAARHARIAQTSAHLLPWRRLATRPGWFGAVAAAFALYIVTAYNIWELPGLRGKMPNHVEQLARIARVNQRWDMFAPHPLTTSVYPIVTGLLRNGERVELFESTSSADGWQPPSRYYALYGDYRTRKYMGRVDSHRNNAVRRAYGAWQCKRWNTQNPPASRDQQLGVLEVWFIKQRTNLSGEPKEESRRMAWRHWCFPEFKSRRVFE